MNYGVVIVRLLQRIVHCSLRNGGREGFASPGRWDRTGDSGYDQPEVQTTREVCGDEAGPR